MVTGIGIFTGLFKVGSFIEKFKWIVPICFLVYSLYLSWFKTSVYEELTHNLRKTWYFLLIFAMGIHFNAVGFNAKDWQDYLLYVSIFVFVDLAIFQTPRISKIWGTELTAIEKNNKDLTKTIEMGKARDANFSAVIRSMNPNYFKQVDMNTSAKYLNSLGSIMNLYANLCDYKIDVYQNNNPQVLMQQLTTQYGIKISQEQYDELNVEKGVLQPETNMVMVATSIVENIVIVVTSQKSIMLDNDISNVYDLAIIHSWLKK